MKHKKITALVASSLCTLGVVGCQPKVEEENLGFIKTFLEKARNSYTLKSKEEEIVNRLDGSLVVKNEFFYDIKNASEGQSRVYQKFYTNVGGENISQSLSLVKDEKGFAATEVIDYSNKVITKPILSDGKKVLFENEFFNPFLLINEKDLTKTETEGKYLLNPNKVDLFSYYLFSNKTPLTELAFEFKGENFDKITAISKEYEGVFLDKNSQSYIPVKYFYETDVLLSNIGETSIEGLKPVASRDKERETILKNALSEITGNYTIIINEHDRENPPNPDFNTVWYFDGEGKVYHQQRIGDESRRYDLYYKIDKETYGDEKLRYYDFNEETKSWEYSKPIYAQSYNADPKGYDWFVPKVADVAPELFKYEEEGNKYVCDIDDVIGYIGNNFLPGCFAIKFFTEGYGDKCEITLNSENKVSSIVVGYKFYDTQGFELHNDFEMNFININSTTIPSWVEGE